MTIQSMTASARRQGQEIFGTASWEIRAVNHRYLDLNIRLPECLSSLEAGVREILRGKLQRGRVECYLYYQPSHESDSRLRIDENLVHEVIKNAAILRDKIGDAAPIDPLAILSWPHVLVRDDIDLEKVKGAILKLLELTLEDLILARAREGYALRLVIENIIPLIEIEIDKVKERLPEVLVLTREKINAKFSDIRVHLDPNRLEQEMVFFAQKIDVAEELERIKIHLIEVKRVMANGGSVGKRLDFLVQELNRESNTLAAKSVDAKITQCALEMKVLLERIREQVQNLE